MLAILASRFDEDARSLAASWGAPAALLTARDLSQPGWRFEPAHPDRSRAVIDGSVVPMSVITGLLMLQPRIFDSELTHIVEADRTYVAEEITSFLLAWSHALSCPVFNQPRPGCLNGPPWSDLRWTGEALRAGLRISAGKPPVSTLSLIGRESVGAFDPDLVACARRLAAAAGVAILSIRFDDQLAVVSATSRPDLRDPRVVLTLRRLFPYGEQA